MSGPEITLIGVGDVRPNRDDPPSLFSYCREAFQSADIAFGQMEVPLSNRGTPMFTPHAPDKRDPRNVTALTGQGAGFDVMSFACNHSMDWGWVAFSDTLNLLAENKIAVVGAGMNIRAARRPAIVEVKGTKVGFLAYLSIVSPGLVAEDDVPGCAPLRSSHFYEQFDLQPGTPPRIITALFPDDKKAMEDDIRQLRPEVDVLVVSMHCGVHMVPALVAMYQKEAAYAAIGAGADLILQHHAHILKGIEMYQGKAVFYGLGNFATEPRPPRKIKPFSFNDRHLREFYGIKPIPGWERYAHHPDARNTVIAKAYIRDKQISKVTYIPAYIRPTLEPEVVSRTDPRGQGVFEYVKQISENQELNVRFAWEGDEVLISSR